MASGKEIRTKIASIKNTQKITKAMEMVSASKMRKVQDRMKLEGTFYMLIVVNEASLASMYGTYDRL